MRKRWMCHVQLMQLAGRHAFGAAAPAREEKSGRPRNLLPCARITSIRFKGTLSVGARLAVAPTPPAVGRVGSPCRLPAWPVAIVENVGGVATRCGGPPSSRSMHHGAAAFTPLRDRGR